MNECTFSFCKTEGSFKIIIIMPNEFPFHYLIVYF